MRIPKYIKEQTFDISKAKVKLDADLFVKVADEIFYTYVGEHIDVEFTQYIHPDFLDEFMAEINCLAPGESGRVITAFRGFDEEYTLVEIEITKSPDVVEYDIKLRFIDAMLKRVGLYFDNILKYREFLSVNGQYLFDYFPESDMITLYMYSEGRALTFTKCELDKFYSNTVTEYTEEEDSKKLNEFCTFLKGASGKYDGTLKILIGDGGNGVRKCSVKGKAIKRWSGETLVAGTINIIDDDGKTVLPYYATDEGKDSLTGLLNKKASVMYTGDLIRFSDDAKHYMAIIDVDNFKDINDSYGHLFGDRVITEVADVLAESLMGRGIVGRFGGDEYFIFTNKINDEQTLRTMLTSMRQKILMNIEKIKPELKVTLSIGCSLYPDDGKEYDELFKKADKCLYIAKAKGRNRFIIYNEERHGNLDVNEKVVSHIVDPVERGEYLATFVADAQFKIIKEGASAVKNVLNKTLKNFELDGIRVVSEKSAEPLYVAGKYSNLPDMSGFLDDEAFLNLFDKYNMFVVGNYQHYENRIKTVCSAYANSNIMASVNYYCLDENGNRIFFFFDVFNHAGRWNGTEKNYLIGLCKAIVSVLE